MEKKIKSLHNQIKKEEKAIFKDNFPNPKNIPYTNETVSEMTGEMESTFREISKLITSVRASIKNSFDEYLNSLASFADTKNKLASLQIKSNENYNDYSPILDKKINLLLNFNKVEEYTYDNDCNLRNYIIDDKNVPEKEINDVNSDYDQVKNVECIGSPHTIKANTRLASTHLIKNSSSITRSKLNYENCYNQNNESVLSQNAASQICRQSEENRRYNQLYDNYEDNCNSNSEIPDQRQYIDYNIYGTQYNNFREKNNQNIRITNSSSHLSQLTPLKPRRIFPSCVSTSVTKSKANNYQQDIYELDNEMSCQEQPSNKNRSRMVDAYYNSKMEVHDNSKSAEKENCSRSSNKLSNFLKSHMK